MLPAIPGTFAAGEMLDWEAPTGGYLLQAELRDRIAAARALAYRVWRAPAPFSSCRIDRPRPVSRHTVP